MIHITNTKRFNQSFDSFIRNHKNSYQTFGEEKKPIPQEILDRISKSHFMDEPLTNEEALLLKGYLEDKIKKLLVGRIPEDIDFPRIHFLGEDINLNIKPTGKNIQDNFINWSFRAYKICEECLEENKPVYLSITEDN